MYLWRIYTSRHDLTHVHVLYKRNVNTAQGRIISNQLCLCISLTWYCEHVELLVGSNFQPHPWFVLT